MKVHELIKQLKKLDKNAEVICQADSEGNGYSPCAGVDGNCVYVPDNTWSGEVIPLDENGQPDEDYMEENDELPDNAVPCVVLFPTN